MLIGQRISWFKRVDNSSQFVFVKISLHVDFTKRLPLYLCHGKESPAALFTYFMSGYWIGMNEFGCSFGFTGESDTVVFNLAKMNSKKLKRYFTVELRIINQIPLRIPCAKLRDNLGVRTRRTGSQRYNWSGLIIIKALWCHQNVQQGGVGIILKTYYK